MNILHEYNLAAKLLHKYNLYIYVRTTNGDNIVIVQAEI